MRWPRLICSPSFDLEPRAVLDAVHGTLGAVRIEHGDDEVAAHRDQIAVRIAGDVQVLDLDGALEVRLDERLLGDLRRAADMERAHGELRARLADRLRGDDADRLAHIDRRAAGEIAPVALAADARLGVAGQHRTDAHLLHAGGDELLDMRLLEQRAVRRPAPRCSIGSRTSSAVVRPRMRLASDATTVPASMMARTLMPRVVPQSSSVMMQSCATSTRRRVR